MNNIKIMAFGSSVPKRVVTNDNISELVDTTDEWIRSRTGIESRHISTCEQENTSYLCTNAAREVLEKTGISPAHIDIIVVATVTPDCLCPSTACLVQKNIGAINAFAFDVNAACSGFIYAMKVAESMLKGVEYKNALVIGGDVMSKIIDWNDRGTCVLFGDGAGAALLTRGGDGCGGIVCSDMHSDGSKSDSLIAVHLPLNNAFSEKNQSISQYTSMDGRAIFDFATKNVPKSVNAVLAKAGLTIEDIKYIVPHQANSRITEVLAKKLKVDISKFYMNISNHGNTTAGSIPIAVNQMIEQGKTAVGSGDNIILTGFGGGLTWGSILINL